MSTSLRATMIGVLMLFIHEARAEVVVPIAGRSPAGTPVAFAARFAFAGDLLTVTLENNSPVPTRFAADSLGSVSFDIVRDGKRPALVGAAAFGQVVWVRTKEADEPVVSAVPTAADTAKPGIGPSPLFATENEESAWQFRALDPRLPPFVGFGLGIAGSPTLRPEGLKSPPVAPGGFALVTDDEIEPVDELAEQLVVRQRATFTFTGADGWGEQDLAGPVTFGLGTTPEGTLVSYVPEPVAGCAAVLGGGLAWLVGRRRGRAETRNYACGFPPPR